MAKTDKMEEIVKEVIPSCLENKRLVIKFYPRPRGFVTNPKHILYGGMMEGATRILSTPLLRNGDYKNVLTNDEKTFLEKYMGLGQDGLSVYKKENNYWDSVKIKLEKGENFFDLNSPEDFIKAKVCLAHENIVAPSIDNINDRVTYMFYAVKDGEREQESHRKLTAKQEAYKLYGKFEEDREVLEYVCKIIRGSNVSKMTKLATLQSWVGDIIEGQTKELVAILNDKQLRTKMLIDKGIKCGALRFIDGEYYTDEGKPLTDDGGRSTLPKAAAFLDAPINQPIRLKVENRIEIAKQ
jgi:hypothetical protein